MPRREIVICGEPVLRKKARPVKNVDDDLLAILDRMAAAMEDAGGVGLAAPQIGESVQAIVVREETESEPQIHRILNPRLAEQEGAEHRSEGCLSLPTLYGKVERPERVLITGVTPAGEEVALEAEGFLARAFCHEIDHLRGVLFIDRVDPDTLVWMVPDPEEEDGYRYDSTSLDQALEAFQRLRQRRAGSRE